MSLVLRSCARSGPGTRLALTACCWLRAGEEGGRTIGPEPGASVRTHPPACAFGCPAPAQIGPINVPLPPISPSPVHTPPPHAQIAWNTPSPSGGINSVPSAAAAAAAASDPDADPDPAALEQQSRPIDSYWQRIGQAQSEWEICPDPRLSACDPHPAPTHDVPTPTPTPTRHRAQLAFLAGQEHQTTASHAHAILRARAAVARHRNAVHSPLYPRTSDDILAYIFLIACAASPGPPPHQLAITLSHVSARFRHVALTTPLLWNALTIDLPLAHPHLWQPGGKWHTVAERTGASTLDITVRIRPDMAAAQAKGAHIPPPDATTYLLRLFARCRLCVVTGHHMGTSLLPARTRHFRFPESDTLRELRIYFAVTKISSILLLLSRCRRIENIHLCDLRVLPEPDPDPDPDPEARADTPPTSEADGRRSPVPDTLTLPYLTHLRVDVSDSSGFHAHGLFTRLVLPALQHLHLDQLSSPSTLLSSAPSAPASFARIRTLALSAPRATLASVLRLVCSMPALRDLRLRSMSLHSSTPASADQELMHALHTAVPPLRKLVLQYVLPADQILHFLVGATTGPPGAAPVSYNAARRRRPRTLERLEVDGGWTMAMATRLWVEERLGEGGYVINPRREEWVERTA
ncbi:hypothetical protein CALCODRAFT_531854 [Calocera cornea HHB12733]|uniref:F-box domain-containing protein n=1 Tax=Calocera cornea HHB12733 TaxID=1353952 RepID=A0A165D4W5_9BASI|nr:hypothetical protein CALCODRAFT_531854 [Calocera cornea HHB12733]